MTKNTPWAQKNPAAADQESKTEGGIVPEQQDLSGTSDSSGDILPRIAQTGRKIRAETLQKLALERTPSRMPPRIPDRLPQAGFEASLSADERQNLIEVLDENGRTLLCMSPATVLRQKLSFSLAVVALRTRQNKIILHKRRDATLDEQGQWDVYTGFVLLGESVEDAAVRLVEVETGIGGIGLTGIAVSATVSRSGVRRTLYVAELPQGLYPVHEPGELLEVDADELEGLAHGASDLLTLDLLWAQRTGGIFRD